MLTTESFCVCVCVCVCERKRVGEKKKINEPFYKLQIEIFNL